MPKNAADSKYVCSEQKDADWKTSMMPKSTADLEPGFDAYKHYWLSKHVALMPKTAAELEHFCDAQKHWWFGTYTDY